MFFGNAQSFSISLNKFSSCSPYRVRYCSASPDFSSEFWCDVKNEDCRYLGYGSENCLVPYLPEPKSGMDPSTYTQITSHLNAALSVSVQSSDFPCISIALQAFFDSLSSPYHESSSSEKPFSNSSGLLWQKIPENSLVEVSVTSVNQFSCVFGPFTNVSCTSFSFTQLPMSVIDDNLEHNC